MASELQKRLAAQRERAECGGAAPASAAAPRPVSPHPGGHPAAADAPPSELQQRLMQAKARAAQPAAAGYPEPSAPAAPEAPPAKAVSSTLRPPAAARSGHSSSPSPGGDRADAGAAGSSVGGTRSAAGASKSPRPAAQRASISQEPQGDQPQNELQKRLLEQRERMAQPVALPEPSGMYEKGRPSPAAAQAALAAAKEDNVGPPFFNQSFLLKVSETLSSSVGKRFLAEVFEKYDQDHNGLLNVAEVTTTAEAVYKVLGLPLPPKRVISDLRDAAASAEAEAGGSGSFSCLGNQGFAVFFMQLMKKAKMKLKAENFTAKQQGGPRRGARPEVPQECPQLPEGLVVEVYAYRWCYPDYEEGAKKLRLRKFHAESDRLPPRDGLVVIGSYRHVRGECRQGGPSLGAYVIGVRDEASGEDFVLDGRGLRPYEPDEDEPESHLRARREAAEVGKCLTVRDRLFDMRAILAERLAAALPPAPKAAAKAAARPSRAQLPAAAFAAFGPTSGRASVKPVTATPPPPPPPAGGACRRGSSPSSSPSGRRTRRDSADPPNLGRKEEWLPEPQWIQAAAASTAEEEGCLDVAKGQWLCVQFIGSGGDAGWSYGANEAGTAGWFPVEVLGGWSPGRAALGNIPEGFGVETS